MSIPSIILYILLIIMNIFFIIRYLQIRKDNKNPISDPSMDKINIGKSIFTSSIVMIGLCLLVAFSGLFTNDYESIGIGVLLSLAFVFQALCNFNQMYLYIGRDSFIFNNQKIKFKAIKKAYPPKGFMNTRYTIVLNNGSKHELPIKAMEELIPYIDKSVIETRIKK